MIQHASNLLIKHGILEDEIRVDDSVLPQLRDEIRRRQIVDKLVVLANLSYEHAMKLVRDCTYIIGGTGRVKNVINTDGKHILSPRLTDGGLSITDFGAEALYDQRLLSVPKQSTDFNPHFGVGEGIPLVVVEKDAIEFVLKGRNVFHGFILACDSWLKAGQTCLIVDEEGTLIGHGLSQCDADEAVHFRKGIAVRTRSDFAKTFK